MTHILIYIYIILYMYVHYMCGHMYRVSMYVFIRFKNKFIVPSTLLFSIYIFRLTNSITPEKSLNGRFFIPLLDENVEDS